MEDIYYKKLKDKSSHQLEQLIRNKSKYRVEAVNCAIRILNERDGDKRAEFEEAQITRNKPAADEFAWIHYCFDRYPYFKQFNGWDLVNPAIAALVCLALFELTDWYANERFMEHGRPYIRLFGFLFFVLTSHLFYRLEHRVSNNLMGRVMNDVILVFVLVTFEKIYGFIAYGKEMEIFREGAVSMITIPIGITMLAFVFEVGLGILKSISRSFKWHIL